MKLTFLTIILSSLLTMTVNAEQVKFDFSCVGPNLHYTNQFDLIGTITIDEEQLENLDETGINIKQLNLEALVRKSGFNTTQETLFLNDLAGTFSKIDNGMTLEPFYRLSLLTEKGASPKIYANILVEYPGIMESYIRVNDLREYRAGCKLVQQ
jgi:hypothetical protein